MLRVLTEASWKKTGREFNLKDEFLTWICPHCLSWWSRIDKEGTACDSFMCHGAIKPYVVVYDAVSCLCCEKEKTGKCFVHWKEWNMQKVTHETKIPRVWAFRTDDDESFQAVLPSYEKS